MQRQRLPFSIPAISYDPKTKMGNGRVAHLTMKKPDGTAISWTCVVPNTVSNADLVTAVKGSKAGRLSSISSALSRAAAVPDSAQTSPLGPEAKAAKAGMLSPIAASHPVPAQSASTKSAHGASFNEGCDDVDSEIGFWDDVLDIWDLIEFEINVCDDEGGDFFYYLIDNGYTQPTTVAVDASAYQVTDIQDVTFTAEIASSRLVSRIDWTWTPTGAADPWTIACAGNDTTCTISVHGTGRMAFTVTDLGTPISGSIGVGGELAPDADSTDTDSGDTDDSSPSTTTSLTPISIVTGAAVLGTAIAEPDWVYTQGCHQCNPPADHLDWVEPDKNRPNHYGDCTDFVWTVMRETLGTTAWPYDTNHIARTKDFGYFTTSTAAHYGYIKIDSSQARAGDVVVRDPIQHLAPPNQADTIGGGHAGIFMGWEQGGVPEGWANNGNPATHTHPNKDNPTGRAGFKQKPGYLTFFFRAGTP
jgi:hypothetical protein